MMSATTSAGFRFLPGIHAQPKSRIHNVTQCLFDAFRNSTNVFSIKPTVGQHRIFPEMHKVRVQENDDCQACCYALLFIMFFPVLIPIILGAIIIDSILEMIQNVILSLFNTLIQWGSVEIIQNLAETMSLQSAMVITQIGGYLISSLLTMLFFLIAWDNAGAKVNIKDLLLGIFIPFTMYVAVILICPSICLMGSWGFIILSRIVPMLLISIIDIIVEVDSRGKNAKYFLGRFIGDATFTLLFGVLWTYEISKLKYLLMFFFLNIGHNTFHNACMNDYYVKKSVPDPRYM